MRGRKSEEEEAYLLSLQVVFLAKNMKQKLLIYYQPIDKLEGKHGPFHLGMNDISRDSSLINYPGKFGVTIYRKL